MFMQEKLNHNDLIMHNTSIINIQVKLENFIIKNIKSITLIVITKVL